MIAYHASHEQFTPKQLLSLVSLAEKSGFDAIHSSDHFHPWNKEQGQSGFAWSWIGAAMQISSLPFSIVCAPGQRYHPAIVAQGIATLCDMFPDRLDIALGSGEALNEKITGDPWPAKKMRNERLEECALIIRRLLKGETVTHHGIVHVDNAQLFTRPSQLPPLFCAAISAETSAWAESWADGLLTTCDLPLEKTKEKVEAFTKKSKAEKPVFAKFSFSYDSSHERALENAFRQWRTNILPSSMLADLSTPSAFELAAESITIGDVEKQLPIITSMEQLYEYIDDLKSAGIKRIILHNVNTNQEQFIQDFGDYYPIRRRIH